MTTVYPPDAGPFGAVVEFLDPRDADLAVYGHVPCEEALASLNEWWLDMRDEAAPEPGPFRHLWAVWREPEEGDFFDFDEGACVFDLVDEDQPGAFPVTLAERQSDIDAREARRVAREEARLACLKAVPYAEIECVHPYGDAVDVTFAGIRARWRSSSPDHVMVAAKDVEAWEAAVDAQNAADPAGAP